MVGAVVCRGAIGSQPAAVAEGAARLAGSAAVLDEEDVHFVAIGGGDHRFELGVGVIGGGGFGDETEADGDAVDVGINGEDGHAKGEEEDAVGGFGAHAVESHEVVAGLFGGLFAEKFEVKPAAVGLDLAEDGLDAGRFDAAKARDADAFFDSFRGGCHDWIPGAKLATEAAESGGTVGVGCVLREDGLDEDVDGVSPALPGAWAVHLAQGGEQSGGFQGHEGSIGSALTRPKS